MYVKLERIKKLGGCRMNLLNNDKITSKLALCYWMGTKMRGFWIGLSRVMYSESCITIKNICCSSWLQWRQPNHIPNVNWVKRSCLWVNSGPMPALFVTAFWDQAQQLLQKYTISDEGQARSQSGETCLWDLSTPSLHQCSSTHRKSDRPKTTGVTSFTILTRPCSSWFYFFQNWHNFLQTKMF